MVSADAIMDVLGTVPDPEMPISIVDLGLVERVQVDEAEGGARVTVTVLPTFVGCPALEMIRGDIEAKVGGVEGVGAVEVSFVYDPPWSVDRITGTGRDALREHGVTVPEKGSTLDVPGHREEVEVRTSAIPCPFCGSNATTLESPFGPTKCRMIFYCTSCRNSFEHLKRV